MDISILTIRLVLLFIPGVVGTIINDMLVDVSKKSSSEFITSTILYGVFSYSILYLLQDSCTLFDFISQNGWKFNPEELFFATGIAITVSIIVSLIDNKGCIYKFARWIGLTRKFGEETVFLSMLGETEVLKSYVTVRDIKNNLMYQGIVEKFANRDNNYELYLVDVVVYNNKTTQEYYRVDKLYIKSDFKDFTLETQKGSRE